MPSHVTAYRRIPVLLLLLILALTPAALCESKPAAASHEMIYGYSENGRALVCHRIGEENADSRILLVFGVHGFEDSYDHDGEVLRLIAHRVIDFFSSQTPENLALYVVPCANPDGLLEGTSRNGFGRCNARGLDINRDFPVNWKEDYHSRTKTGSAPFSTAEARALRDLVEQIAPDFAADIHGWIDAVYGSTPSAEVFAQAFGMKRRSIRSGGTLAQWMQTTLEDAILLELPANPNEDEYVTRNSEMLIQAILNWIALPDTRR